MCDNSKADTVATLLAQCRTGEQRLSLKMEILAVLLQEFKQYL